MPEARWSYLDELPKHNARDGDYIFDRHEAERAVRFFNRRLWIPEGDYAGQRFTCPPWMEKYASALYGWRVRAVTISSPIAMTRRGRARRYQKALLYVPRGNLKSMLGCGIGLKTMVADGLEVPVVVGAGTDKPNAAIIFGYASYSAKREPALAKRLAVFDGTKRIARVGKAGSYKVIAAKETHSHGGHPLVILVDDLQAQPHADLLKVLRTSQITLDDPLFAMMMTAGLKKAGPGWLEYQIGMQIERDPTLNERYLAAMFYANPGDDLEDPAVQRKANPSLGISIAEATLRQAVKDAKERPDQMAEVMTLNFNIWTDVATASWLSSEAWDETADIVDESKLRGRACDVGIAAMSSTDIAAVVYVFAPTPLDPKTRVVMDAFVPTDCIAAIEERTQQSFAPFVREGWITPTSGDVIDEEAIVESVKRRQGTDRWNIQEIVCNPRGAVGIMRRLQDAGFECAAVTPGFASMSPAMREWERQVLAHELAHGGDRALGWMMRNLRARHNGAGDLTIDGEHSPGNITGPVAGLMALGRAVTREPEPVQKWGLAG